MPKAMPGRIIRDWTIYVDRVNKIGQVSELKIPKLERKVEEVFNGGMIAPIDVPVGFEKPEMSFKMTGFDPQVLQLFGLKVGDEREFMGVAQSVDDDGEERAVVSYWRGYIKQLETDDLKRGDVSETSYELCWRYWKLEENNVEIFEFDPFDLKVGGQSQTGGVRRNWITNG